MIYKLEKVHKHYTNSQGITFSALQNIDLEISAGEFMAIMGASGSGKTTLSNILGFLSKPSQGQIFFKNQRVDSLTEVELDLIREKELGFIFQDYVLIEHLSALENVMLPLTFYPINKQEAKEIAQKKLKSVGLGDKLNHYPHQLSGGQKQRVSIARALVKNPSIIIADEPAGALDIQSKSDVLGILQELNSLGSTIIMVTHSLEDSSAASRIIKIENGKIADDSYNFQRHYFIRSDKQTFNSLVWTNFLLNTHWNSPEIFWKILSHEITDNIMISALLKIPKEWLLDFNFVDKLINYSPLIEKKYRSILFRFLLMGFPSNLWESTFGQLFKKDEKIRWSESEYFHFESLIQMCNKENIQILNPTHLFSHESQRVKSSMAKKIEFLFKMDESYSSFIPSLLSDPDDRVVSNLLESLANIPIDIADSHLDSLKKRESERVKVALGIFLHTKQKSDEAQNIMSELLSSQDINSLKAGLFLAKKISPEEIHNLVQATLNKNAALSARSFELYRIFS